MKKIISSLIILNIIIISNIFITPIYAMSEVKEVTKVADTISLSEMFEAGKSFVADGEAKQDETFDMGAISEVSSSLYGILVGIGFALAVVVGVIIGIKFMMSSSSDEKAQYKKTIIVYVVGVIVIFGAYGIWNLVINMMNEIEPQQAGSGEVPTYVAPAKDNSEKEEDNESKDHESYYYGQGLQQDYKNMGK